jgi:hypothetical protein
VNRELAAASRALADSQSASLQAIPDDQRLVLTITAVVAGGAKDGNAKVTVAWRGKDAVVNGYNANYTPVIGHRVVCDYIDNQIFIDYRPIGQP